MPAIGQAPGATSPHALRLDVEGPVRLVGRCVRADDTAIELRDAFARVTASWATPPPEVPSPLSMV
ncbi:MAG: hypothetical protein RIF41_25945, partial [Polyangiaceae bacterium]